MTAFNGYITALFGMDSWQNHARKPHVDGWMDGIKKMEHNHRYPSCGFRVLCHCCFVLWTPLFGRNLPDLSLGIMCDKHLDLLFVMCTCSHRKVACH